MGRVRDGKKKELQPVTRDYTLNLHKILHGIQFKKRAPRAVRDIKRFATKEMYTQVRFAFCHYLLGREGGHLPEQVPLEPRNQKRSQES